MKTTFLNARTLFQLGMFILIGAMLSLQSCKKDEPDPIAGCMDPQSDNYNPDAEVDDGNCVPWRDKFIGDFTLNGGTCVTDLGISNPGDMMTIEPSSNATAKTKIIMHIVTSSGTDWTITANITGKYELEIPSQPFTPNPVFSNWGSGTIDSNGNLSFELTFSDGSVTQYFCDYEATVL